MDVIGTILIGLIALALALIILALVGVLLMFIVGGFFHAIAPNALEEFLERFDEKMTAKVRKEG